MPKKKVKEFIKDVRMSIDIEEFIEFVNGLPDDYWDLNTLDNIDKEMTSLVNPEFINYLMKHHFGTVKSKAIVSMIFRNQIVTFSTLSRSLQQFQKYETDPEMIRTSMVMDRVVNLLIELSEKIVGLVGRRTSSKLRRQAKALAGIQLLLLFRLARLSLNLTNERLDEELDRVSFEHIKFQNSMHRILK